MTTNDGMGDTMTRLSNPDRQDLEELLGRRELTGLTYITGPRHWAGGLPPEALSAYEKAAVDAVRESGQAVVVGPTFWRQFATRNNRETARSPELPSLQAMATRADVIKVLKLPGWQECAGLKAEIELATAQGNQPVFVELRELGLERDLNTGLMRRIPQGGTTRQHGPGMRTKRSTHYTAVMKTTDGDLRFNMDPAKALTTCGNFIYLCDAGFYDGTQIGMVVKDHTIRGGCTRGDGTGTAGYHVGPENGQKKMQKGQLAMIRDELGDSCQWFIVTAENLTTTEEFSVFGTLADGEEALNRINAAEVNEWKSERPMAPKQPITVTAIRVEARHEERFEPEGTSNQAEPATTKAGRKQ